MCDRGVRIRQAGVSSRMYAALRERDAFELQRKERKRKGARVPICATPSRFDAPSAIDGCQEQRPVHNGIISRARDSAKQALISQQHQISVIQCSCRALSCCTGELLEQLVPMLTLEARSLARLLRHLQ